MKLDFSKIPETVGEWVAARDYGHHGGPKDAAKTAVHRAAAEVPRGGSGQQERPEQVPFLGAPQEGANMLIGEYPAPGSVCARCSGHRWWTIDRATWGCRVCVPPSGQPVVEAWSPP